MQGMLQSLLYDSFVQNPSFVQLACLNRLSQLSTSTLGWSLTDLRQALERLIADAVDARFCFFIDGVDEFIEDLHDVTTGLKALASHPKIKICFSSRPWTAFTSAFPKTERLVMEANNRADIESYVNNILGTNVDNGELMQTNSQIKDFAQVSDFPPPRHNHVFGYFQDIECCPKWKLQVIMVIV